MMSPLRLALLAGLLPAFAHAADDRPPDVYRELVRTHIRNDDVSSPLYGGSTREVLQELLAAPDSPYSEPLDEPRVLNETWWPDLVLAIDPSGQTTNEAALERLRRQLGLTKARPGTDVPDVTPEQAQAYVTRESAAQAIKAGVRADIFRKALDLTLGQPALAAGYALALQVLDDQTEDVRSRYATGTDGIDHFARLGIRPEVFARVMAARAPHEVTERDQRYLADVLRGAMLASGSSTGMGAATPLDVSYRIARLAAAYTDAGGYVGGPYCSADAPSKGQPTGADALAFHRPLCFVAATDRGVFAWYRAEVRDAAERERLHRRSTPEGHFGELLHWIGTALLVADFAGFVETIEAVVADDLAFDGLITEEEASLSAMRAKRLQCRIAP